jgi:hypothetical protein
MPACRTALYLYRTSGGERNSTTVPCLARSRTRRRRHFVGPQITWSNGTSWVWRMAESGCQPINRQTTYRRKPGHEAGQMAGHLGQTGLSGPEAGRDKRDMCLRHVPMSRCALCPVAVEHGDGVKTAALGLFGEERDHSQRDSYRRRNVCVTNHRR